jgi:hypothetical protein
LVVQLGTGLAFNLWTHVPYLKPDNIIIQEIALSTLYEKERIFNE